MFLAKIKYSLEKNLSKFVKKFGEKNRKIFENLKIGVFFSFLFPDSFQTVVAKKISSREECGMCRSRRMLKNAYLDAKIGVDTEENEPSKVL